MLRNLLIALLIGSSVLTAHGQVTLNFSPLDTTLNVGDTVTITVNQTGMDSVAAVQLDYQWDSTVMVLIPPLQSVNDTFNVGGGWQYNQPDAASLKFNWLALEDHSFFGPLFQLRFKLVGAGTTQLYHTQVVISNSTLSTYTVTVDTATITASGTSPLALSATMVSADPGANQCVEVKVDSGFADITKLDFSLSWDSAIAAYTNVTQLNAALGLTMSNFDVSQAGAGKLGFTFSDTTGHDLPAGTVLFSVCYDAVGAGGSSTPVAFGSTPAPIVVENSGGAIGNNFTDGAFSVNTVSSGTDTVFHLYMPDTVGQAGSVTCVPVTVKNFNKMTNVGFSISWDTSVVHFASAQSIDDPNGSGPLGGFNVTETTIGNLGYLFFELGSGNTTLPDYSVLADVCFSVVGNVGDVSPLTFGSQPITLLAQDSIHAEYNYPMTVDTNNGSFTVVPAGPVDTFHIFGDFSTCTQGVLPGDTIAIDIFTDNLDSMLAFQAQAPIDTANLIVLEGLSNASVVLPHDPFIKLFNFAAGKLSLLWLAENSDPYTWPDSVAIGTLYLVAKPGAMVGDASIIFDPAQTTANNSAGTVPAVAHDINLEITTPLVVNANVTELTCGSPNSGAISLTASGWTGNYTYNWTGPGGPYSGPSLTGLAAGTYTVTVTSCNEQVVQSYTLQSADAFTLSVVSLVNEAVPPGMNGSVEVAATGPSTYSYSWTGPGGPYSGPSLTGLTQGDYTVIATDNAGVCSDTLTVTIAQLNASGTYTNPTCNGANDGTITLNVSGGTPPYSYQWNMGPGGSAATNLPGGLYNVTVTDSTGAQVNLSFNLVEPPAINIQLVGTVPATQGNSDGAVDISVSGGTPGYTYSWTGGYTTEDLTNVPAGDYTVTVTDSAGCTMTGGPYTVTEMINFSATAAATDVNCNGGNDGMVTVSIFGGQPNYTVSGIGTPQISDGSSPVVFSGLSAGSYTVTVTDANGLTTTASATVNEPPALVITNISVTPSSGANGAISYDVSGGTPGYSFDWSDNTYDGQQNISGLAPGSYSVTVSDAHGCTASQSFVVPMLPAPVPDVTTQDATCFNGATGSITINSVTGGTPDYTITGSGLPTQTTDGTTPVVYQNLTAGSYSLTLTDNVGADTTFTVTINQPPQIVIDGIVVVHETVPPGNNGSINVNVSGGTPPYNYQWSPGGYTTEDISNLTASTYTLTVTDANGCMAISTPIQVLQQSGGFTCSTDATDTDCPGSTNGKVILTVTGGAPPLTYKWTKDNSADVFSTSKNLMNVGTGVYHVTVTDNDGNTTTCDAFVGQQSNLTGSIHILSNYNGYNVSGFGLQNGQAEALPQDGIPPYQFAWSSNEFTATANSLAGGTNSVTITDNIGCVLILDTVLTEPDLLVCQTTIMDTPCEGSEEGAIDLTPSGGVTTMPYQYQWTGPNGYAAITEDIANLAAGAYFVTVTDANGNTTSCNATVNVLSNISVSVNVLSDYNGFDVSSAGAADGKAEAIVSGGQAPYSYLWSTGDTIQMPDTLHAGAVSVTVTDALGCSATADVVLTAPGVFTCNVVTTNTVCPGSTEGTAAVVLSGGVMPIASYVWTGPGGNYTDSMLVNLSQGTYSVTVIDANGSLATCSGTVEQLSHLSAAVQILSQATSSTSADGVAEVFATGATSYTYQWSSGETTKVATALPGGTDSVVVTDNFGCTVTISFVMPVADALLVDLNIQDVSCFDACDGKAVANVVGGTEPYTYLWNSGATEKIVDNLCAGAISVTVTDANGLSGVVTDTVGQPDSLSITFDVTNPSSYSAEDGSATAVVTGGTPPYTYLWDDGNPATTGPTISNKGVGTYLLVVSDANHCTLMRSVELKAETTENCFSAPLVLTPSLVDGKNDVFAVSCLDNATRVSLQVFSRWGQLVYHHSNYDGSWTGIDDYGKPLPEGAYFWVMKVTENNEEKTYKGHVTIVR